MLENNILVVDDFFENPNLYIALAKTFEYYKNNDTVIGVKILENQDNKPGGLWVGLRSDFLHLIDKDLFNALSDKILEKVGYLSLKDHVNLYAHFHFSSGNLIYNENWWHNDNPAILSGIIYLSKYVPNKDKFGTNVIINNEERHIQNKFNRLVAYPSMLQHRLEGGFGDNIDNTRLTLVFFVVPKKL